MGAETVSERKSRDSSKRSPNTKMPEILRLVNNRLIIGLDFITHLLVERLPFADDQDAKYVDKCLSIFQF